MKLISIVTPCFNEEENIEEIYKRIKEVFKSLPNYTYEQIFIDNCSTDNTLKILRGLSSVDKKVRTIVNARNFGHIRSPFYGLLQAEGDAAVLIASDMQDPPEKIPEFIKKWEEGFRVVIAVKKKSEESKIMFFLRRMYYKFVGKLSEIELIQNFTGYGLYDKKVIEVLRQIDDPYPYFRGLICDIGFERAEVEFTQPARKRGNTKNNFYSLFDMAMLGITSHSKIPLRIATMLGFSLSIISILIAFGYLVYKIIFWTSFSVGMAPLVIGVFFFSSVQLFFIGIVGEYLGLTYTQVLMRPLVIEKERINFNDTGKK